MELSYWEKNSIFGNYDVIVIGSGIVGLSTAIFLMQNRRDLRVAVLERGNTPQGASTKNAGFACFGSLSELIEDEKVMSADEVVEIIEQRMRGLRLLKQLIRIDNIDLQEQGGYELFLLSDDSLYSVCRERLDFYNSELNKLIGKSVFEEQDSAITRFRFKNVKHVIYNDYEAQLNPALLLKELISHASSLGVTILNAVEVEKLESGSSHVDLYCNNNTRFKANKVVVCTNGFAKQLLPQLEVEANRAQVLITFPVPQNNIKGTFHYNKGYYYFRDVGERILIGGARHIDFEAEKTYEFGTSNTIQSELEKFLQETVISGIPFTIQQRWSGIMGLGNSKQPLIKWTDDHILCAVRLGGMGIALGSLIGQKAAKKIIYKL